VKKPESVAEQESREALRASLAEREAMLKEIYHRVKNNLQVVSSLMYLQSKEIEDPISRKIFMDSSTRIKAMSLVHEMLYQSGNLAEIEVEKYVKNLSTNLIEIYHVNSKNIKLIIDIDAIFMNIEEAIPFGLIVNELLSNTCKHAFTAGQSGEIIISVKKIKDAITLTVSDNGIGFLSPVDLKDTTTFGTQLIHSLTKQLNGKLSLDSANGTTCTLVFSPNHKGS
jgi:two-component sensor histidine kinase